MLERPWAMVKSQAPVAKTTFELKPKPPCLGLDLEFLVTLDFSIKIGLVVPLAYAWGISFFKSLFGNDIPYNNKISLFLPYLEDLPYVV